MHEQYVVPMASGVDVNVTAIIGCAVMTGCGAVTNTAGVKSGETVAIFGAGGVGLCAVQAAANVETAIGFILAGFQALAESGVELPAGEVLAPPSATSS